MNKFVSVFLAYFITFNGVVSSIPVDDGEGADDTQKYKMPTSCQESGFEFCFENDGYPMEIVKEVLKDMKNLVPADVKHEIGTNRYLNRQGGLDEPECPYKASNDTIYYIKDENDNDRVVVQMKGRFEQHSSLMWCINPGRVTKTTHFTTDTLSKYKVFCENKYMHYDFLVLSLKPDILGKYYIEQATTKTGVPVCCACRYYKDEN